MKFARIRTVKPPYRGTAQSAGIDFFVPQKRKNETYIEEFEKGMLARLMELNPNLAINKSGITLKPGDRVMIPSGVKVNISEPLIIDTPGGPTQPFGLMLTAHNKSGIGTKKGLDRLAEVVDSDYQGEVHISVVNTGNVEQLIRPGEKLIQFVLEPVVLAIPEEVSEENLFESETERGDKGFGEGTGKD